MYDNRTTVAIKRYVVGSIPTRGNSICDIFNFTTQRAILKNSAETGERSALTLGSQVPFAYPAMCRIQSESKKIFIVSLFATFSNMSAYINIFLK